MTGVLFIILRRPKNTRNWCPEHSKLPTISIDKNKRVSIRNFVHARYDDRFSVHATHGTYTFNLSELEGIDVIAEHFPVSIPGGGKITPVHILLSFTRASGDSFSVSVAGRRLAGEGVDFWRILPHRKEIFYKIIDEKDTLIARALVENDTLYLYPLRLTQKQVQKIFMSIAHSVNTLARTPAWFDTFTRNCITEAFFHLKAGDLPLPRWHWRYSAALSPEKILLERNLIETDARTIKELQNRHRIDELVRTHKNSTSFGTYIRRRVSKDSNQERQLTETRELS